MTRGLRALPRTITVGTIEGDTVDVLASENTRWRIADQTAAFLSIDRDVCRRAFYGESLRLISVVVEYVCSHENDADYDPERMIEDWARNVGAGVYAKDGRYESNFVPVDRIVSGELLRLALERPELRYEDDYHLYLVCIRIEEERLGRQLTTSELDRFTRKFYAPSYRRNLEKITKERWDDLNSDLEHDERDARRKHSPRREAG